LKWNPEAGEVEGTEKKDSDVDSLLDAPGRDLKAVWRRGKRLAVYMCIFMEMIKNQYICVF